MADAQPADGKIENSGRVLLGVLGVGLMASGVVAAFVEEDGVKTAALLAAGFAVVFVAYLGRYITRIRFREFEAELASLQRKVSETKSALESLETVARRYEAIRADMRSGGRRDDQMEDALESAVHSARAEKPDPSRLEEWFRSSSDGDRIAMLGAMKAHTDLRDPELVLKAIEQYRRPFDHDRFMLLASEMVRKLDAQQRATLQETIERQRSLGVFKEHHVRWATSERLLRMMAR